MADEENQPQQGAPPPYQGAQGLRAAPVRYIRNLQPFKHGSDLLHSYCRSLRVPDNMLASLLVAHLDDAALRGISRHLDQDLEFREIVDVLNF